LNLVGGQVAGGRRRGAGEGRYFVQIPFDQAGQNLCDAIDALNALPQVSSANFITYSEPLHRRPNDGPGWQRADWSLRREGITLTSRWGLEAIAAPLAWGCEVGSESVALAVVDVGFQSAADDVYDQVSPQWRNDIDQTFLEYHGTAVSAVAAAMGNDGRRMTGVMWQADLSSVRRARLRRHAELRLNLPYS
jgi:subtilisin family serine protease